MRVLATGEEILGTVSTITPGIVQWFRFQNIEEVMRTVRVMKTLGVTKLRTVFSWADWDRPGSRNWFDWFVNQLASNGIEIFPSIFYTPPGRAHLLEGECLCDAKTCYPPARPEECAEACKAMLERYGDKVGEAWQIWNEVNNDAYWSPTHDPDYKRFIEMAHCLIDVLRNHNRKIVLGGIIPPYTDWLCAMKKGGVLQRVDALGIHAFPGTWDKMEWQGWPYAIAMVRDMLSRNQEVWITETGLSTVTLHDDSHETQRFRERQQIDYFEEVLDAPAEQVFWFSALDQAPDHPTDNALVRGTTCDPRAYHFGLIGHEGRPKPLYEHWRAFYTRAAEPLWRAS